MQNLEQIRARNALVAANGSLRTENDGEVVKKVPAMIRTNGILAAAAFAAEKGGGHEAVFAANVDVYCVSDASKDWKGAQHFQATFLKTFRAANHLSGKQLTPLGAAVPRQASALHLRPVKLAAGSILPLAFYTASILPANIASQPFRQLLEKTEGVSQLA